MLSKVYINLIDQKEPSLNFKDNHEEIKYKENKNVPYFKKIIEPTDEEFQKHKIYLKENLKKNFFN